MSNQQLKVYKLDPSAILPIRKSAEAAGYDVCCLEDFSIGEGEAKIVRTGLVMQPPPGYHIEAVPRSGLAYKYGIMLKNNVGVIDRDYAGPEDELKIMLYRIPRVVYTFNQDRYQEIKNHKNGRVLPEYNIDILPQSRERVMHFKAGDRIAQILIRKTESFDIVEVPQAPKASDRGGFGSTGV